MHKIKSHPTFLILNFFQYLLIEYTLMKEKKNPSLLIMSCISSKKQMTLQEKLYIEIVHYS